MEREETISVAYKLVTITCAYFGISVGTCLQVCVHMCVGDHAHISRSTTKNSICAHFGIQNMHMFTRFVRLRSSC